MYTNARRGHLAVVWDAQDDFYASCVVVLVNGGLEGLALSCNRVIYVLRNFSRFRAVFHFVYLHTREVCDEALQFV